MAIGPRPSSVAAVALLTLGNLRGIREAGTIFAVPTYAFVATMYVLIAVGLYRPFLGGGLTYVPPPSALAAGSKSLGIFLLLSAFAQGCTAMTGTEAISDGVLAFEPPEAGNARKTLLGMGLILGSMFLGMSYLATHLQVQPTAAETVLSQLGRTVFGEGPLWVTLQIATALILVLATAFADFPRLGFTSFTLSQAGMVAHWRKTREPGWKRSMIINGMGMVATAIVTLVIASTKFAHGAWLVVLPEYVPSHWWEHALHNQTALRLRAALLFHPGVIVTNVPYHVSRPRPKPV